MHPHKTMYTMLSTHITDKSSQIIKGGFSTADEPALSRAISLCSVIISLLGPNVSDIKGLTPTFYADLYAQQIFPLMRQHSVRRIFVMNTVSVYQPDDSPSFIRWLCQFLVWIVAGVAQKNMYAIQALLEDKERSKGIEWTAFRLGLIPGGCDEQSWRKDREGEMYAGPVGAKGHSIMQKRAQLAKWLVEAAVNGAQEWIHRMPAVSRLSGGRNKVQ